MNDDTVFDPKSAGAYLGGTKPIARQTLAIMRLKGNGPDYYLVGGQVRYRKSDLDAWTARGRRSNTSQRVAA